MPYKYKIPANTCGSYLSTPPITNRQSAEASPTKRMLFISALPQLPIHPHEKHNALLMGKILLAKMLRYETQPTVFCPD